MVTAVPYPEPLRLAVFDCDGTLVDSGHSIVTAMHAACDEHGCARPAAEEVRRMVGLPLAEAFARLLPGAGAETLAKLKEGSQNAFGAMRRLGEVREPLFPGALEGLTTMEEAGWLLAMATGKSHRGLVSTLNGHGLGERFVTLQTADRCQGKPHPEMLLNAMAEANAKPSSTVMIGDTTYDMEMARNAGTLAVGVSWGYHGVAELKDAGADAIIDAFEELPMAAETLLEEK